MSGRPGEDAVPIEAVGVYLELSKRVNILMQEEEVMHLFIELLQQQFPGFSHCIRLIDESSGTLDHVLADGLLAAGMRDRIFIAPAAFETGEIPPDLLAFLPERVEILDEPLLVFEGSRGGLLVALVDEERLLGTMHVEWGGEEEVGAYQKLLLHALGHHMTGALRSTRLYQEATYLRSYLTKLIDNANAPIVIIDGKRRILTINRQLEKMTGFDKASLVGTDFLELFDASDRQRFVSVIIKAMKGKPTANFETRIPRKGGGEAQIAFNVTSILDQYGKVEAVIAVGQDLTEVRRLQNQMLHSERLMTIGELSAGVVHEINNPLTSISVYSEYLVKKAQDDGADADTIKRLQRIHQSAQRIFQFTQQLMAYARPGGDEPTLVDVAEVLNKSLGFCEHIIRKSNVAVVKKFGDDMPPVYGIEGQLGQVFVNLITNACHSMAEKKGGQLFLIVERGQEGTLSITVADQGEGITPEGLKEIFEPFYTTKKEGEGTGLGLSIVKNIITSHEGDISVRSKPGEGTSFIVTLYTSE
jgi:PAS domain S-box-containing protein